MRTMIIRTSMWLIVASGLLASPLAAQDYQTLIVQMRGKAIGTTRTGQSDRPVGRLDPHDSLSSRDRHHPGKLF